MGKIKDRYSSDGKFYPAEIRSIESDTKVKVIFLGYSTIELVDVEDLR